MKRNCRGFSLIAAVFLLVVVALLGTYMVTIGTTQQMTATLSLLSSRAVFAAESGMQWSEAYVLKNNSCFGTPDNFSLSGGAAGGYTVTATCSSVSATEGTDTYNVFKLTATAMHGTLGSPDYVQRKLRATVTTAP
jgi:MSHA biogenesis protein MshP